MPPYLWWPNPKLYLELNHVTPFMEETRTFQVFFSWELEIIVGCGGCFCSFWWWTLRWEADFPD